MQNGTDNLEDSLAISYKTKHTLTIQSSNCAIYPKELRTYVPTETFTQMFLSALFIIAKTWGKNEMSLGS